MNSSSLKYIILAEKEKNPTLDDWEYVSNALMRKNEMDNSSPELTDYQIFLVEELKKYDNQNLIRAHMIEKYYDFNSGCDKTRIDLDEIEIRIKKAARAWFDRKEKLLNEEKKKSLGLVQETNC